MPKYFAQSLMMPDGNEFEFYGKSFFGVCSTAADVAPKTVNIPNFTPENLVEGTKITVLFERGVSKTSTGLTTNYLSVNGSTPAPMTFANISFSCPPNTAVDLVYFNSRWQICNTYQPDWFGECRTISATQTKEVMIQSFNEAALVPGARVTIYFISGQGYNGTPKLNISNTGAKDIRKTFDLDASQHEWADGQLVTFIYCKSLNYNTDFWVIDDGAHADTTCWGKTKLSNTIADDATVALTPKAVYDAGFITTETDPTVPAWAKQNTKPSYTASEVGAIAAPSSPATGSFLVWDGLAWVAQTLSTWQGGNY